MKRGYIFVSLILCVVLLVLAGCSKPTETKDKNTDKVLVEPTDLGAEDNEELVDDGSIYLDMQKADFTPYDGAIFTGVEVRKALKMFRNSNVAVLVATQMVMDGTLGLNQLDGNVDDSMPTAAVTGIADAVATTGEDLSDKLTFVNYGALLKDTGEGVILEFKDGYLLAKEGLLGDKKVNLKDERATTDGYAENIAEYLHMKSYLVKDADGRIIGIAFYAVPY